MSRLHAVGRTAARATTAAATAGVGPVEQVCQQLQVLLQSSATTFSRGYGSQSRPGTGSGLRRVNIKPLGSAAAAADEASTLSGPASSTSESLLEMGKEVPGGSKPLRTWEKWYWGAGVVGISGVLYWNLGRKQDKRTPEEIEAAKQRASQLEAKRKEHVRAALMGQNFIEGESDPLDGLSPKQIVLFMEKHGIDPSDPLEGLSPEEINAYVQQQEERRQQE